MRLDRITTDAVAAFPLDGSPSWQNQALRTLSVILAKAVHPELGAIRDAIDQPNNRRVM
jgi:hypothetical protein